jgi:large subunit ribosomal protein L19
MNVKNIIITPVKVEDRKALDLRAGDTVKVWQKIEEKEKTRLQVFEGLVLAVKHGKEAGGTFTVRKIASGVGVERTFPIYSPAIEKIEIVKRSKVRQSKLYHIREKVAKEIKRQMRNVRDLPEASSTDESESERAEQETEETESEPAEVQEEKQEETPDQKSQETSSQSQNEATDKKEVVKEKS